MVKRTQTICRPLPTNCLSVFDYFVSLTLKGLRSLGILFWVTDPADYGTVTKWVYNIYNHIYFSINIAASTRSVHIFSEYRGVPILVTTFYSAASQIKGVFRTQSNIFDEAFLQK